MNANQISNTRYSMEDQNTQREKHCNSSSYYESRGTNNYLTNQKDRYQNNTLMNHEVFGENHPNIINSDVSNNQNYTNRVDKRENQRYTSNQNEYENNQKSICKYNLQKRCIFGQNRCRNLHVNPENESKVRPEYETRNATQKL